MKLRTNADTSYESAEDMWDSLGFPGHPACSLKQLKAEKDDDRLANKLGAPRLAPLWRELKQAAADGDEWLEQSIMERIDLAQMERDEILGAITYGRRAIEDMRGIAAALRDAVMAYKAGDLEGCIDALEMASSLEREYGDDPAASELRAQLLDEDEDDDEDDDN